MAILKNKTQKNFTMISNIILRDKRLKMIDKGVLCTICGLPDKWEFSIAGLCCLCDDGKHSISNSVKRLEQLGYLKRSMIHGKQGKFETELEVILECPTESGRPLPKNRDGKPVTDNPSREIRNGKPVTDNQPQYNTDNIMQPPFAEMWIYKETKNISANRNSLMQTGGCLWQLKLFRNQSCALSYNF